MKNVLIPCLLSAGLAAAAVFLISDRDAEALSKDGGVDRIRALEDQVAGLREALAARPLTEPVAMPTVRISQSDIEDAVAKLLAEKGFADRIAGRSGATKEGVAAAVEPGPPALDLDQALALLRDPTSSRRARQEMWAQLQKAGLIESAIDQLEELIEGDPTNAELHAMLGTALIQKLFGVENDMEKGMVAMAADAAFNKTLELNDQHWDARFSKAVSLSFWPPITGKGPEAVSQFEQLISQQEAKGDLQPQYAESYLYLGNLYQQQGNAQMAKQAWSKGAMLFPDHAGLKSQLGK